MRKLTGTPSRRTRCSRRHSPKARCLMMSARFGVVTSVVAVMTFTFIGHSVSSLFVSGENASVPLWVPTLDIFDVVNPVAHGHGIAPFYALAMTIAFCAWCALFLIAGSALFAGRDL